MLEYKTDLEKIRQAIIKKTGEYLPENRFRILKDFGDGRYEVNIVWDEYDREVRTVEVKRS